MPPCKVVFYKADDGSVPVKEWLGEAKKNEKRLFAKCLVWIAQLAAQGQDLRRPLADTLRDGIHELRIAFGHTQYRILYFFHKRGIVVLAHALVKERKVPEKDIEIAIGRKGRFEEDPEGHTYE
jgi:phage-related protein